MSGTSAAAPFAGGAAGIDGGAFEPPFAAGGVVGDDGAIGGASPLVDAGAAPSCR